MNKEFTMSKVSYWKWIEKETAKHIDIIKGNK